MIIQVGKYNVDNEGFSYDKGKRYYIFIFEEFDKNDNPVGNRKVFYIDSKTIPELKTEKEIEEIMRYKNYSKIKIEQKIFINLLTIKIIYIILISR